MGWSNDVECSAGADDFRGVIAEGEKFLKQYPASAYRADVLLAIAEAYETWWSLSQSNEAVEGQNERI